MKLVKVTHARNGDVRYETTWSDTRPDTRYENEMENDTRHEIHSESDPRYKR